MRKDSERTVCRYHKIRSRTTLAAVYVLEVYGSSLITELDIRHGLPMLVDTSTTFLLLSVRSLAAVFGQLAVESSAKTMI